MSHWTKIDHITFLIALVLSIANIFLQNQLVTIVAVIFLLIAFVYDLMEHKQRH